MCVGLTRILALLSIVLIALTGPAAASSSETLEAAARVMSFLGRGVVHLGTRPADIKIKWSTSNRVNVAELTGFAPGSDLRNWLVVESPRKRCVFGVIDSNGHQGGGFPTFYVIDFSKMTRWYETAPDSPVGTPPFYGYSVQFTTTAKNALVAGDTDEPLVFHYLSRTDIIVLLSALDRVQDECPLAEVPIN